jgi:hypothetical protein
MVWPSPAPVTVDVRGGSITLPVRSEDPGDARLRPFDEPEAAPLPAMSMRLPERGERVVERDPATGEQVVRAIEDGGVVHYDAIDLDCADRMDAEYRMRDDDPRSARASWTFRSTRKRADWDIAVEARMTVSATADTFLVVSDLEAFENGQRVFARTWRDRVARDHV